MLVKILLALDMVHDLKKSKFNSESNEIISFLERSFVRLEAWFQWFNTSQSGIRFFLTACCFVLFPFLPLFILCCFIWFHFLPLFLLKGGGCGTPDILFKLEFLYDIT